MKKVQYESNGTKYTVYITPHEYQWEDGRVTRFSTKYMIALEFWQTWMWVIRHHGAPHYTYVREKLQLRSDLDAQAIVDVIEDQIFNGKCD